MISRYAKLHVAQYVLSLPVLGLHATKHLATWTELHKQAPTGEEGPSTLPYQKLLHSFPSMIVPYLRDTKEFFVSHITVQGPLLFSFLIIPSS